MKNNEFKNFCFILIYCIILYSLNWNYKIRYENLQNLSSTTIHYPTITLSLIFSSVTFIVIFHKFWKTIREFLNDGVIIPKSAKLTGSKIYLLLLSPLFFKISSNYVNIITSTHVMKISESFNYGSNLSPVIVIVSAVSIILFQVNNNLHYHNWKYRKSQL